MRLKFNFFQNESISQNSGKDQLILKRNHFSARNQLNEECYQPSCTWTDKNKKRFIKRIIHFKNLIASKKETIFRGATN